MQIMPKPINQITRSTQNARNVQAMSPSQDKTRGYNRSAELMRIADRFVNE